MKCNQTFNKFVSLGFYTYTVDIKRSQVSLHSSEKSVYILFKKKKNDTSHEVALIKKLLNNLP